MYRLLYCQSVIQSVKTKYGKSMNEKWVFKNDPSQALYVWAMCQMSPGRERYKDANTGRGRMSK